MVPKETISRWLNTGFDNTAVLGVGMSAETARQLLLTGEVPYHCPNPDMIPYQKRLVRGGKFLYYTYPFMERFSQYKPALAKKMVRDHLDEDQFREPNIMSGLEYYGFRWSIQSVYQQNVGVWRNNRAIVATAAYLFPKTTSERIKENPELLGQVINAQWDQDEPSGLDDSDMSLKQLRQILDECMRRRGVLVFYNDKVFNHRILTNHEDGKDIMILANTPLTAEVVSGIKPLSNRDRGVLLDGIAA